MVPCMVMILVDVQLRHIKSIPLFSRLAEVHLATLALASTERRYEQNEVILLKGDQPSGLFAVVSGRVKMSCQGPSGDEKVIGLRGARDVFGEESLYHDRPYAYMATALSRTSLLHIDTRSLRALVDSSESFRLDILAHMSQRLFLGLRDIENLRIRSPLERLAGFLHDQTEMQGDPQPKVNLQASKQVIASRLGMTPESFSRCLRDMVESGIVDVCGRGILILDRARMAALLG